MIEIAVEIFVNHCIALCSLDDDECYGVLVHIGITQFLPVNVLLVVADVYAADMVTLGVFGLSVDGLPLETVRIDEEME